MSSTINSAPGSTPYEKSPEVKIHFERGRENDVVCVFSCPGREEEKAKRPAAGTTGKNLKALFLLLNEHLQTEIFARGDVTITNAWKEVEYQELTGRSEAEDWEILKGRNLVRLLREIRHVEKYIICFGDKASLAVSTLNRAGKIHPAVRVARTDHLSLRRLNSGITKDVDGNVILNAAHRKKLGDSRALRMVQGENTQKRLMVLQASLISQLTR